MMAGKEYRRFEPETLKKFIALMKDPPQDLTRFEAALLNDRFAGVQQYGVSATATVKQIETIERIIDRYEIKRMAAETPLLNEERYF